ncbi:MAG: hypothetical protein COU67_00855 [Candidatus Pacebacteria bacterium CG10_big_fil_rev_8_21_14_0_10_44_54]|nr:MAG: hypothetical protein COU67_00855 [Candidatus Pacebacteria bacterium CG10_big_fil_rev_8_21_14_0_10_44_54]
MKILKISSFYPRYLDDFYFKNPNLRKVPFSKQQEKLNYDAFGWADFWPHALGGSEYEMTEITANNRHAQLAWARENNLNLDDKNWYVEILRAQARKINPDLLFFEDRNISRDTIESVKSVCPNLRHTTAWCGTHYKHISEFDEFDSVIGCIPDVNQDLQKKGARVFHLSHAFDTRILERVPMTGKKHNLSFVGQILDSKGMHGTRSKYLETLASNTDIEIFSPQLLTGIKSVAKVSAHKALYGLAGIVKKNHSVSEMVRGSDIGKKILELEEPPAAISKRLRSHMRPAVFGLEMFSTMRNSNISFNIHIEASKNSASNMRLFEATGMGSCLLTDNKKNLSEFFKENVEVMTYDSQEDCLEKISWLQKNQSVREKIAKKGQEKTVTNHTFSERVKDFVKILDEVSK